jgi:hypothetical protein
VIFTGALAKHLSKDDPKVHSVVEKLLDVLNTPSEAVQRAVSDCLSPLMVSKQVSCMALSVSSPIADYYSFCYVFLLLCFILL